MQGESNGHTNSGDRLPAQRRVSFLLPPHAPVLKELTASSCNVNQLQAGHVNEMCWVLWGRFVVSVDRHTSASVLHHNVLPPENTMISNFSPEIRRGVDCVYTYVMLVTWPADWLNVFTRHPAICDTIVIFLNRT